MRSAGPMLFVTGTFIKGPSSAGGTGSSQTAFSKAASPNRLDVSGAQYRGTARTASTSAKPAFAKYLCVLRCVKDGEMTTTPSTYTRTQRRRVSLHAVVTSSCKGGLSHIQREHPHTTHTHILARQTVCLARSSSPQLPEPRPGNESDQR